MTRLAEHRRNLRHYYTESRVYLSMPGALRDAIDRCNEDLIWMWRTK